MVVVETGDYRVLAQLRDATDQACIALGVRPDRHFLIDRDGFDQWAADHKSLRLGHFYRHMRQRTGLLMNGDKPVGGIWNSDKENRRSFGVACLGRQRAPQPFPPNAVTKATITDVKRHFADHPGSLAHFDWPVTAQQAEQALEDFVQHRLRSFGPYQDALDRRAVSVSLAPFSGAEGSTSERERLKNRHRDHTLDWRWRRLPDPPSEWVVLVSRPDCAKAVS